MLTNSGSCGSKQTKKPSRKQTLSGSLPRLFPVDNIQTDEIKKEVTIKDYIAGMGNRFGEKPVAIRSDNGKEYLSKKL